MHITSGLSPVSGELLDGSTVLHLYDDGVQCGTSYLGEDFNMVPESSHTVEIEYVCEQGDYTSAVCSETDYAVKRIATQGVFNEDLINHDKQPRQPPLKKLKTTDPTPVDDNDLGETDLTNLTWLQNITNIMSVPTFSIPPVSPTPAIKPPPVQNTRLQKFNKTMEKCQDDFADNKDEYRTNHEMKPPYSYSTLICMAMRYNENKITLSAIYSWIRDNFKYYRNADPTWQNSIRHNLSLNKVFVKVARSKQEPGKGGFWKMDLTRLEDNKRSSGKPHKKKKTVADATYPSRAPHVVEVHKEADLRDEYADSGIMDVPKEVEIGADYTDLNMAVLQPMCNQLASEIGANVIVEPAVPPPLMAEDDLTSMLLNPTEWDDLQLDMLDSYLDSCFK